MKPYGRCKFIHAGHNFRKVDVHPIPKREYINWWEDLDTDVPRTTIKANVRKEIESELLDDMNNIAFY